MIREGTQNRLIMGIDPGTNRMGYGLLKVTDGKMECLIIGDIDMVKMKDPYEKLGYIFRRVAQLTDEYQPDEVALESPFFGENVQSMLKLGRAQGVAMAAALSRDKKVFEYPPTRVKQAITGTGSASKEQVAKMLQQMLHIEYDARRLDATDGLAVALCHHLMTSSPIPKAPKHRTTKRGGSWERFVAENPEKIVRHQRSTRK